MNRGFSLVELSIVLVIIGLIAGGIVAGQSLIRSADLKAQTHQIHTVEAAIELFQTRHAYLPGDHAFATEIWGAENTTPSICQATASTDRATCNGNGDGLINDGTYEMYRAWQHLANEGLIEGEYTGVQAGTSTLSHDENNAYSGELRNTVFSTRFFPTFTNADWFSIGEPWGHILQLGGIQSNFINERDILSPREVSNMDIKLDDGQPARGKLVVFDWTNCTLATAATQIDTDYDLQETDRECSLVFRLNE